MNKIGSGRTAEIFEYDSDKIIKLFRENFPKEVIEKEYEMNIKLSRSNLLIPKCYEIVEKNGRYGIIYERIKGITIIKKLINEIWKIDKFAEVFAEIHNGIQKNINEDIPENKKILKENIEKVNRLSVDTKIKILEYLDKLPDGNKVCHGDFHPDNIIESEEKYYVIDWITLSKGHEHSDVARTLILLKYGSLSEKKSTIEKIISDFIRKIFYKKYIKYYLNKTKSNIEEIQKWEIPHLAARLIEDIPEEEKEKLVKIIEKKMR